MKNIFKISALLFVISYSWACSDKCKDGTEIGNGCPVRSDAAKEDLDPDKVNIPNSPDVHETYQYVAKVIFATCQSMIVLGSPVEAELENNKPSLKLTNDNEKYTLKIKDVLVASSEFSGEDNAIVVKDDKNKVIDTAATCSVETITAVGLDTKYEQIITFDADDSEFKLTWIINSDDEIIEVKITNLKTLKNTIFK